MKIEDNKIYLELKNRNSDFVNKIDELYFYVNDVLPKINNVFDNYTEHGIEHSVRVLNYMTQLIDDIQKLSELELTIIIYVALLHDIGMVINDKDKQLDFKNENELGMKYSVILEKYGDTKKALQEYYRPVHGIRAFKYIKEIDNNIFCIPQMSSTSFADDVAKICQSHTENNDWIKSNLKCRDLKGRFSLNCQYIAILLRVGDILDIDENRTPIHVYKLFDLDYESDLEWKQHFNITNTEKIFSSDVTKQKRIEFHGNTDNVEVHRKLLKYIDYINYELEFALNHSKNFSEQRYTILINEKVSNYIETKGFSISDFRLTLDYKAITGLLMGEKIYGDKKYGLREIIQNSIDACKVMKEIKKTELYDEYKPLIKIILNKAEEKVRVYDNGIGMTIDILKKYFLNIGVSYYSSNDFEYKGFDYKPIGNYGIGFLACFMLSDKVNVITKHYKENSGIKIEIKKCNEFIILTEKEEWDKSGTEIIFNYHSFMSIFKTKEEIKKFIEENFLLDEIDIEIIEVGDTIKKIPCESMERLEEYPIILNKYFNGIKVKAEIKYLKDKILKFEDIVEGYSETGIYIYEVKNNKIVSYKDTNKYREISKFIEEDRVSYLKIPIIHESISKRFESLISLLDDWEEAFDKIENSIDYYAYIFAENFSDLDYSDGKINDDDNLIGELKFSDFCEEVNSNKSLGTKIEKIEKRVFHQNKVESILVIDENEKIGIDVYSWLYSKSKEKKQKIYNKNVFLSKASIRIPYKVSSINLGDIIINFESNDIIPNLARNNIDDKEFCDKIGFALGKAIHLYIIENDLLEIDQKELFNTFILKYYSEDNKFFNLNYEKVENKR